MPRFLIQEPPDGEGRARLRGASLRHLRTVLRLAAGDEVELFDGRGRAWSAVIRSVGPSSAELAVTAELAPRSESPLRLTLAVALPKGAKLDWVVEKSTELGVTRIVPFVSERTVAAPRDLEARAARWARLAESATAQCGRTTPPRVSAVGSFADVLALAASQDRALLFHEEARSPLPPTGDAVASVLAVTGPEGGFTAAEASAAARAGLRPASLGPRILRAETAAVAAAVVCQLRWGDLAGPARLPPG